MSFFGFGLQFGGGQGSAVPVAADLPAMTSQIGSNLSGWIQSVANIGLPSGDWCVGGWFRAETNASNYSGYLFALYPASGSYGLYLRLDRNTGTMLLGGTDSLGVTLGANKPAHTYGSTQTTVLSTSTYQFGTDVFIVCQKIGNKAQIWLKFNGHSPCLVAEETTNFGAVSSQTFRWGRGSGGADPLSGNFRNWFKLSYSLTQTQMEDVANGTDPTTLGTYASDDFRFPMGVTSNTWTSTINGITTTYGGGNHSEVSNLGYAPMTNAVLLDPVGGCDGFVFQHEGGSSLVPLSGIYRGADGGNIEVQFLDQNNVAFQGWHTVATNISGGTWSGSVAVPKGKRWIKVQMRKSTSPTEIMTSTLRWGIGYNIVLGGESLMAYMNKTGYPYGTTGVSLGSFISLQSSFPMVDGSSDTEVINISGAANNGGLIEITTSVKHGQKTGNKVVISSIVGTTEANNKVWTVTVTGPNSFTLDGSSFTNSYVSSGKVYIGRHYWTIPNLTYLTYGSGLSIICNAISDKLDCVISVANRAVSGTSITNHYSWTENTAPYTLLAGHAYQKVGAFVWEQGQNNIGLSPIHLYYSDSGTDPGTWTGWGCLGVLLDFYKDNWPNNDFKFAPTPMNSMIGNMGYGASTFNALRHGIKNWSDRKIISGDSSIYNIGHTHDLEPMLESNGIGKHMMPIYKGQLSLAARLGHDTGVALSGSGHSSLGPSITSAVRSGAQIDLTVTHNGGASLKVLTTGARPSGFQCATDTGFTSLLTISDVSIVDATTIRITLSSDPGVNVYIRYMYGFVSYKTTTGFYQPLITDVADNGAGLIRVTTATSPTSATVPTGSQRSGGHGLSTGDWVKITSVKGATQANGTWQVTVIDSEHFDLIGSDSTGLGTYQSGSIYTSGSSGVWVATGVPIYDDRTIGTVDTNGAPLQPLYSYVTAA